MTRQPYAGTCPTCGDARPHYSRGLCSRCYQNQRYRTNEAFRNAARRRVKLRALADGSKECERVAAYRRANRDRVNTIARRSKRLRRAAGYCPDVARGVMVTAVFLPKPGRVVKRYVLDGQAVADVDLIHTVVEGVPMTALEVRS